MALGGGTFIAQNKKLPGAYINFVSLASASATLSDRGYAALGILSDWGQSGEIFEVTNGDFQKNSLKIFGYSYDNPKLKGLRDLFLYLKTLYAYRLNGDGKKAENDYATAKYAGIRGNDLKIIIAANADNASAFDVTTVLGTSTVDVQTVTKADELVANDWVTFKKSAELTATAGIALTGGTNGEVNGEAHQKFLDLAESKTFNTIGCVSTDDTIKRLYASYVKRLRDDMGKKFQAVIYQYPGDYEGVINVKNKPEDGDTDADLVYWVTGAEAGCDVNKSLLNKKYDGEYKINVDFTQSQLEKAIDHGEFTFHQVDDNIRVLSDINSLVTTSDTKGDIFKDNQTIRVIDQIGNDIAVLFNTKYLGVVPNDNAGRISLWSDIVQHHEQLQAIRAIENFTDKDVTVSQGLTKKAVVVDDAVTVVNAMEKLYMTVTIS